MEFRPLRRTNNAISEEAAKDLLQNEKRAVLAMNGEGGYPYAVPIDYYYDRDQNKIYFHGAKQGQKFDCLSKDDKVCFTVYGNERHVEDDWAPLLQSTIVFGRCHMLETNEETLDLVRVLARRYYPVSETTEADIEKEISGAASRVQIFEIEIEHLCGKQIKEK